MDMDMDTDMDIANLNAIDRSAIDRNAIDLNIARNHAMLNPNVTGNTAKKIYLSIYSYG